MNTLPSYEDAVSGGHWLDLAAPYMPIRSYSKLCRVSRRFYSHFSPRLWNDPIQTARLLGLHPNDDLEWLVYFFTRHAKTVRISTRSLVASLDFRALTVDTLSVTDASGHNFPDLLRQIGVLFPAARCILIGAKLDYDPASIGRLLQPDSYPEDGSVPVPQILDISHCGLPLPNDFFHLSYWRQLVFLDMSHLPGSMRGIIKTGTFTRGALPNLRILKLQGRGLTEESFTPIAEFSKGRLWSLDLSQNNLTDASVYILLSQCFGRHDLNADNTADGIRAEVEGKLVDLKLTGPVPLPPVWRGWLSFIQESPSSGTFTHPDRHLADAPVYDTRIGRKSRLSGNEPLRSDSAQDIKIALTGGVGCPSPDWHDARDTDICTAPSSVTHLHVSGNPGFTVEGLEAIFRRSRGYIRNFDCESPMIPTGQSLASRNPNPLAKASLKLNTKKLTLAGILGRSHVFRPVFASDLQSLRVHHSLVTHTPTLLDADPVNGRSSPLNLSLNLTSPLSLSAVQYAETVLRERAEMAYPLTFVPDLNPRLQFLTLTRLPRVSSGPVIDSLIHFLISASDQEATIRRTAASLSRRSPTMLRGLRHIRLEFDPWPRRSDDHDAASALDSLDAGALLNSGADDFSFFKDEVLQSHPPAAQVASSRPSGQSNSHASVDATPPSATTLTTPNGNQSVRMSHYPLPGADAPDTEYVNQTIYLDHDGARHSQTVPVWVGSGFDNLDPLHKHSLAVQAYMANLADPELRANVRPATPDQVMAGVPIGVCVYNLAWDAIVWLESGSITYAAFCEQNRDKAIRKERQAKMKDVVQTIRQFRARTKAEYTALMEASRLAGQWASAPAHRHWMGKLELLLR